MNREGMRVACEMTDGGKRREECRRSRDRPEACPTRVGRKIGRRKNRPEACPTRVGRKIGRRKNRPEACPARVGRGNLEASIRP
jgi:hypothetical protein